MTLYTSDIEKSTEQAKKKQSPYRVSCIYLCVSVFCALFGAVYEYFSHGVYSPYMIFAFLIPLVLGWLVFFLVGRILPDVYQPSASYIWHCASATLTVGCIMRGVLDIYGTQSPLLSVYPAAATVLFLAAIGVWLKHDSKRQ